jgi:hypothetical protein
VSLWDDTYPYGCRLRVSGCCMFWVVALAIFGYLVLAHP